MAWKDAAGIDIVPISGRVRCRAGLQLPHHYAHEYHAEGTKSLDSRQMRPIPCAYEVTLPRCETY